MHHLAVKNNFSDTNSSTQTVNLKGGDRPVCPKPRRLGSTLSSSQLLNHSLLCSNHQQINVDGKSGILNITTDKRMDGAELGRCNNCLSTSYEWCGSPPRRTDNPLVHDVRFLRIHRCMEGFPPCTQT